MYLLKPSVRAKCDTVIFKQSTVAFNSVFFVNWFHIYIYIYIYINILYIYIYIYIHIYTHTHYIYVYIYIYIPLHEQEVTQGHFLKWYLTG